MKNSKRRRHHHHHHTWCQCRPEKPTHPEHPPHPEHPEHPEHPDHSQSTFQKITAAMRSFFGLQGAMALLTAVVLIGCGTTPAQKEAKALNTNITNALSRLSATSRGTNFDEPSQALRSVYAVECPKCKRKQFLVPLRILGSGGTSTSNGTLTDRTLYFMCSKRTCKNVITTHDQVLVEPTKAVRVR